MRENIVSPFPAGAGRSRDFSMPDWMTSMTGAVSVLERDRPGGSNTQSGSLSPGATGALTYGIINGVPCARLTNGVTGNGGPVLIFDGGGRLNPTLLHTNVHYSQATDAQLCLRVYVVMAVTATPTDATDQGLEIVLGSNAGNGIIRSVIPGWGMLYDTAGGVTLFQGGNNNVLTSVVIKSAAQGFVNTAFNMFEIRILGATPTQDGIFKVLLNNQPAILRSFGSVPDNLPLPSAVGGNVNNGYVVNVQAMSRNSEIDVALLRVQAAPFEAAFF